MNAPPPALQDALAHHRAGRLAEAEAAYRLVLDAEPDQPDALNLFGVLCIQKGAPEQGVESISRAAALRPDEPSILVNLGTALLEIGEPAQATEHLRRALSLAPDNMDAVYNLANALYQAGEAAEAETLFHQIITAEPNFPPAHNNMALCLLARGAEDAAVASLQRALKLDPSYVEARGNMGATLFRLGRYEEAGPHLEQALALHPDYADAHNHMGALLTALERYDEAQKHLETALRLSPGDPEIHLNIGNLHGDRNELAEAEASYRRALDLAPNSAAAHNNLGGVLNRQGAHEEALPHLTEALRLRPDHAGTWNNLGLALRDAGRYDEALDAYDRALAIDPDEHDARLGRGFVHLLHGRFAEGWADYGARENMVGTEEVYHRTPLDGDLSGRHALVDKEQGLGDELFFLRFLPGLRAHGAHVSYRPDPRLADMLSRAGIADDIVAADTPESPFDLRVSVGDLPCLLGATETPQSIHLKPTPEITQETARRLESLGPPPYLAVTWRAGIKRKERNLFKESPLEGIAAALRGTKATVLAVQRAPEPGEIEAFAEKLGRPVHDLTALNADLEAMLALMAAVDVYVCVSNTNVHLRTAGGRLSHVLVPNPPEFRWMADGPSSPWFPETPVYRQKPDGDWSGALGALADDLIKVLG